MSKVQALRDLPSVRERCGKVYKLAQEGKVDHFKLDEGRYDAIIEVCAKAINVSQLFLSRALADEQKDYGTDYASVCCSQEVNLGADPRFNPILAGDTLQPPKPPTS